MQYNIQVVLETFFEAKDAEEAAKLTEEWMDNLAEVDTGDGVFWDYKDWSITPVEE